MLSENGANGGPADFEAQFAQFPFQLAIAQSRVVLRYPENPLLQLSINGRTSCAGRFC